MTDKYTFINEANTFSKTNIEKIRDQLEGICGDNKDICVVTVGSFARREASTQSDIDFYIIYDDKIIENTDDLFKSIEECIRDSGIRMPSNLGPFNASVKRQEFLENIGGNNDSNISLTRRMLFLLECEWLSNENFYKKLYEDIINTYVKDKITQHQLCRFLLNDFIRYYRTMCVDFEYKTCEDGKSWGDRNIKLMFSRKLLYFSALLVVAETVQHTYKKKREILLKYFDMTPIERIFNICGDKSQKVLDMYNDFLEKMSKSEIRKLLNETTNDRDNHKDDFRDFKNLGHHFSWELSRLLCATYDISHPIHQAIKF